MKIKKSLKYTTNNQQKVFNQWSSFLKSYGVQYEKFQIPDIIPDIIDTCSKTNKMSEKQFNVLVTVGSRLTLYRNKCLSNVRIYRG